MIVMRTRKENKEGSCRKIDKNKWECVVQSTFINPKTMKPKRFKRTASTEKEARELAQMACAHWEKEIIEYNNDSKVDKSKTFGAYMEEYMNNEVKNRIQQSSWHGYYRDYQNYFVKYRIANLQLHMLSVKAFEEYYSELATKYAKKTIMTPVQWCRQLCGRLVDRHLIKENFALQAEPPKVIIDEFNKKREDELKNIKKIYTIEDVEKIYNAYQDNLLGDYPLVGVFLLETGLRAQEFASITNDNIDFESRTILIEKTRALRFKDDNVEGGVEYYTKVPKNKKQRIIYMSDLCMECVKKMQEKTRLYCNCNVDNYLFPTFRTGKPRTSSSMETCWKELCNKLDIDRGVHVTKNGRKKGLCLHSLRDTMNSLSKAYGTPTSSIALMLGHGERVNESHYTFANPDVLKSVMTPSKILEKETNFQEGKNKDFDEDEIKLMKKLMEKYKDIL